jgi:hypothetical protein
MKRHGTSRVRPSAGIHRSDDLKLIKQHTDHYCSMRLMIRQRPRDVPNTQGKHQLRRLLLSTSVRHELAFPLGSQPNADITNPQLFGHPFKPAPCSLKKALTTDGHEWTRMDTDKNGISAQIN